MAKRSRTTNAKTIDQRIREGRGQGKGADYRPWLSVQNVPSQGLAHRVKGWTTGRVHHLLSNLERDYFSLLDWSPYIQDIREQYPLLPLGETLAIAQQCGIRHPTDPKTQQCVVMTTDFLVDVVRDGQRVEQARAVKLASALEKRRTLEKLEIERLYWQARQVDWGIVTEHEIPKVYTKNVRTLHSYKQIEDRLDSAVNISEIKSVLFTYAHRQSMSLEQMAHHCDATLGLPSGTSLTVIYHLLATRQWHIDLNSPLDINVPLRHQAEGVAQ